MFVELLIFILTVLIGYFLYTHKRIHNYLDKNGIKYLPGVPVFGNVLRSTMEWRHFQDDIGEIYKAFPGEKYVAMIENTTPIILIRDPELIKRITVKDFDHFVDHREIVPKEVDTLLSGSVFQMSGNKWKDMRTTLSPAFTGSKMKLMVPCMVEVSNNFMVYLKENSTDEVDIKDLTRRYTNDVIASAGFGLQVNSLKDRNNEFYLIGRTILNFSLSQKAVFVVVALFPYLAKKIGLQLYPQSTKDFFKNVTSDTMEYRKYNNVERPDMIQLLMEAYKGNLKNNATESDDNIGFATVNEELKSSGNTRQWTLEELIGQIFIFFAAGYDTTSTSLTMAIHEISLNPDVQEKLYQELREFKDKESNLTYDNVNELKYLDCVLNESFRKWSAAVIMDRICTQAYELPPPQEGGKPYTVKPGDAIYNVVNCIHMDPKYYAEPEKFDPERFSNANKHNIKPFTFMPFGSGPRNCIGSRFAILELKIFLYHLILNFKILKSPNTTDPIELDTSNFTINSKGGTFVKLVARNSSEF